MTNIIDEMQLNPNQKLAVLHNSSPLLILAGAGTGKTKTVTSKIAYCIHEGIYKPEEIMAVTFTNKASKEMKERIELLTGMNLNSFYSPIWVGTFHSVCIRMLRQHAELAGLSREFKIIDQSDQNGIIRDMLKERGFDTKLYTPRLIGHIISRVKNKMNDVMDLGPAMQSFPFGEFFDAYQAKLQNLNCLDFDEIILRVINLLKKNEEVRSYYQRKFRLITVDEYQDVNKMQYEFIKLLSVGNNLCCVGDDDQSIYGWRGAEVQNIINFTKDFPDSKQVTLDQNYRSCKSILEVADALIQNNSSRLKKKLWTSQAVDNKVTIAFFEGPRDEANKIISQVEGEVKKYGESVYAQTAILYRSLSQTRILEEGLFQRGIPYQIIGGMKFYDRKEIKDIMSYLYLVVSDKDQLSLERAISYPKRGIGPKALEEIIEAMNSNDCGFADLFAVSHEEEDTYFEQSSLFAPTNFKKSTPARNSNPFGIKLSMKQLSGMSELAKHINIWRSLEDISLPDLIIKILADVGYETHLQKDFPDDWEDRVSNINELLTVVNEYESIEDFLQYSMLSSSGDYDDNKVAGLKVMTIHAAKGLEFDTVFLPSCNEGFFPNQKSLEESGNKGLEEERRIAYVALTRAKSKLFLSHTSFAVSFKGIQPTQRSCFIDEIIEHKSDFVHTSDFTTLSYKRPFQSSNSGSSYTKRKVSGNSSPKQIKTGTNQEQTPKMQYSNIKVGDLVMHKQFGHGKILNVSGKFAEVEFFQNDTTTSIRTDFLVKME